MMEDWTDIIGEQLDNIEEPLPADDWSVLQQKYAASRKRKRAAAFAWAGGLTSVAAAIALVLLLVRPDATSVIPNQTVSVITDQIEGLNGLVTETDPLIEGIAPADSSLVESPSDTVLYVAPPMRKKASAPVDVVKRTADDVLIAEDHTEKISSEKPEEVFDVIRDTTSLKDKLLADASASNKKDAEEDEHVQPTGTFGYDDFPEVVPQRKRIPMSVGVSGSVSGSPIIRIMAMEPTIQPSYDTNLLPKDSTLVETPEPMQAMMRNRKIFYDKYNHEIPISFGVSARFNITQRVSFNTGLNYTRYTSTRTRFYNSGGMESDKQYAHYLGIPARFDLMAVNRKHFNFYLGAGLQMDKCVYAVVGGERLHEKQVLFGINGAMGIQVNIVPTVGLYFEPEITYSLNEGMIETFRSNEALMISARGGLRFNF